VNEYRVTKYNPAFRDSRGAYTREEWISVRQIGESFAGIVLTRQEYDRVEDAYVNTALAFLREAGLTLLTVESLENHKGWQLQLSNGSTLSLDEVAEVIRQMLQEKFWCRLQADGGFIHIGWDYYMYVGVPRPCPTGQVQAERLGLYVEEFCSPYKDVD
jgi:hypothetical protein